MCFANTHMHSTYSDGVWTPEQLIELGQQIGHKAMILTDHDTITGQYRFHKAARKAGILTMLGVEFGCKCSFGRLHLVAVDFDPENPEMRAHLKDLAGRQTERSRRMFERGLERGTLRPGVTWQEVLDAFPDHDYFCNNTVFELMVAKGIYKKEEYNDFCINNFRGALNSEDGWKYTLPPVEECIQIVLNAGGVPIIAHPGMKGKYMLPELAEEYVKMGVKGFEICHPLMTEEEKKFYNDLCDKHNLYKLGGIDHDGLIGGYVETMPGHDYPPEAGFIDEENFMKLYKRELG